MQSGLFYNSRACIENKFKKGHKSRKMTDKAEAEAKAYLHEQYDRSCTPEYVDRVINGYNDELFLQWYEKLYTHGDVVFICYETIDSILLPRELDTIEFFGESMEFYLLLKKHPTNKTIVFCEGENSPFRDEAEIIAEDLPEINITFLPERVFNGEKSLARSRQRNPAYFRREIRKACNEILQDFRSVAETVKPKNTEEYVQYGKFYKAIETFKANSNITTGFEELDLNLGGGLVGGALYVIGAAPGIGKTTYALQLADHIASTQRPVLFFSLEMSQMELVSKSIARTAREMFPSDQRDLKTSIQIRKGEADNEKMDAAEEKYIDECGYYMNIIQGDFYTNLDTIRATIEGFLKCDLADTYGPEAKKPVVIIDYLQAIKESESSRAKDIRSATDEKTITLKQIARDCEIPVIAISSFNRSNYMKTIDFESFKESGGIEFTADVVIGLQFSIVDDFDGKNVNSERAKLAKEKEKPERDVSLKCVKNRYGVSSFDIKYKYYAAYDYFREIPHRSETKAKASKSVNYKNMPVI